MSTKILIAEDDVLISEELNDILTNYGFDVVGIAEDYEAAVKIIEETPPDIALLDINMHGKEQGFEIATYLNETAKIPFLFLTSYSDTNTLKKAGSLSPSSYITKPFSKEQVFSAINIAITSYQEEKQPIIIKDGLKNYKVNKEDFLWLKADGIYIELYTTDKKIILKTSIKLFLEQYPTIEFTRIHRSNAVNLKAVTSITNTKVIVSNHTFPLGRSYKEEAQELFHKLSV